MTNILLKKPQKSQKYEEKLGPTEKFIRDYGNQVHQLAFKTKHIKDTFASLEDDRIEFLTNIVSSREEGLTETFVASTYALLVNEYIQHYDGFDGFFTKSNVTLLITATSKQ